MINKNERQAFIILTNRISKKIIRRYHEIEKATASLGDVFLLYHTNNIIPVNFKNIRIENFSDEILFNMNYTPIKNTLVPGSNHYPVLKFFIDHPGYTNYWCLEDDVAFNGKWDYFFQDISSNFNYDFITSHIRKFSDKPTWFWWRSLKAPDGKFTKEDLLNSFNPVYRISNKALLYIDSCLKNGYSGHHEVILPTLLKKAGFSIADFSAVDNHVTPALSYCTLKTMRWKPVFFVKGNRKNTLYHPVKSKVTFKQILLYIKRNIYGQTEYFQ